MHDFETCEQTQRNKQADRQTDKYAYMLIIILCTPTPTACPFAIKDMNAGYIVFNKTFNADRLYLASRKDNGIPSAKQ